MMKFKFKIPSVAALAVLLLSSSCVETFVMDPGEKDLPVVVNCLLRGVQRYEVPTVSGSGLKYFSLYQELDLYYAKGPSEEDFIPITDAKVYIVPSPVSRFMDSEGRELDTLFFRYSEGTRWVSEIDCYFENGAFDLEVSIPGHDLIHARTSIAGAYEGTYQTIGNISGAPSGSILLSTLPRPCKLWIVSHRDKKHKVFYDYYACDAPLADDFNVNGMTVKDFGVEIVGNIPVNPGAAISLRNFIEKYPDSPLHEGFLRLEVPTTDIFDYRSEYGFDIVNIFSGPFVIGDGNTEDHMHVLCLSDEYDVYLRSVYAHFGRLTHDLSYVYSHDNLYSNIEGGTGIFGACRNLVESTVENDYWP